MKKYYLLKPFVVAFLLVTTINFSAKAQYTFGATLSYAIAADDLGAGAKNGFGITLEGRKIFDEFVKGGINIGYYSFANKNSDSKVSPLIDGNNLSIIPVTLACQVYFSDDKFRPYVGLDVGWATANLKLVTDSKNYMVIAPQLGVEYTATDRISVRLEAKDNLLIYRRLNSGSDLLTFVGINLGGAWKF